MASEKPFVSILTDFGFKKIFADPTDTSFLQKTIEIMIQSETPIKEVRIDNTHKTADMPSDRGAVYDVSCTDDKGREFIVEMQRTKLSDFIHRVKFYSNFRLNEMVEKGGEMKYDKLRPLYTISFLDGKAYPTEEFHHIICLRNQHGELIDDQITHIMLELGKWNKLEHEAESDLDKLILLMKFTDTATEQDTIPKALTVKEWTAQTLEKLRTNNLTSRDRIRYKDALIQRAFLNEENRLYEENLKTAQQKVEDAQQKVEDAQQKAETAQQEAEDAQQKAETAQQEAEAVKQEAEAVKQEAEAVKQEAEAVKQEAEATKQEAEATKQEAEATKQSSIKKLLKKGILPDENIAEIFDVDIEYVLQIKGELES